MLQIQTESLMVQKQGCDPLKFICLGGRAAEPGRRVSGCGLVRAEWGTGDTCTRNQKLPWTDVHLTCLLGKNSLFVNTVKSFSVVALLNQEKKPLLSVFYSDNCPGSTKHQPLCRKGCSGSRPFAKYAPYTVFLGSRSLSWK